MQIVSSYQVELLHINKALQPTINIGRNALAFCVTAINESWGDISTIASSKQRFNFVEKLFHATKDNPNPKYAEFDTKFYKMPTYFRRAVIQHAIGIVSSYQSNYKNWLKTDQKAQAPTLQLKHMWYPTFYNDGMYAEGEGDTVYLKLYNGSDWIWQKIAVRHTDLAYLQKYWSHVKASAPTMEKRHGKYYLRFTFEENVALRDIQNGAERICAVDLGINTDAVCTIMQTDGTILARKFINFPSDKDRLCRILNRIKKFQREHSSHNVGSFWSYAQRVNDELSKKIACAITDYAVSQNVDVIVFEKLDMRNRQTKSQRISLWRKNGIQTVVEHKAHRRGIRVSHVCASNTSALAFDGTGHLTRNTHNRALAVFTTGKQYNCDLNASYNIGARYFIREKIKTLDANPRSCLQAKVPEVKRRTLCTYATLLTVNKELSTLTA